MKYLLSVILFVFINHINIAQTASDALRYSQQNVNGTARFIGVGGAMGALGTDYSVLSTNPAGLATYRKSELVLTPSVLINNTTAELQGFENASISETDTKFKLNNVGVILHTNPARYIKWKSFNVGVGYNRVANYNQTLTYEGAATGSLAQSMAEAAQGLPPEQLSSYGSGLAYQTGAIYDFYNTNEYTTDFDGFSDVPVFSKDR